MLRAATRASLRLQHTQHNAQRSFVSSVLLSKTYDDKTVAELRSELRVRGLSVSGTKATLITRIQQADVRSTSEAPQATASPPTPSHSHSHSSSQTRTVSSSPVSHAEPAPDSAPPPRRANAPSPIKFNIKLPDVSNSPPESPVQIPFLPDFWESSTVKAKAAGSVPAEPSAPKIMLAAGAETHPAGGPTFAMSPATDTLPSSEPIPQKHYSGIVGDVLDDLGVPHDVLAAKPASSVPPQELAAKRNVSRPLDEEERRGAVTLLGLFLGAWVIAGIAAPSKDKKKTGKTTSTGH